MYQKLRKNVADVATNIIGFATNIVGALHLYELVVTVISYKYCRCAAPLRTCCDCYCYKCCRCAAPLRTCCDYY